MTTFLIKVALAICAFAIAVLGVSDLKSVTEQPTTGQVPWYRRLTFWGKAKIAFAVATLLLGGLNEYRSASSAAASATKQAHLQETIGDLTSQAKDQQSRLVEAKAALSGVAAKLDAASRTIDLLDRSARSARVLQGVYQAAMSPMSGIEHDFVDRQGAKYQPVKDDRIEFSLICRGGPTPPATFCPEGNYGYLIADADKIPITQAAGSYVFRGSRSTGGIMTYEAPTSDCTPLRQQLENAFCEIDLDVSRVGAQVQLDQMAKEGFPFNSGLTDTAHDDLCRAYEILYGRTCAQDIPAGQTDAPTP